MSTFPLFNSQKQVCLKNMPETYYRKYLRWLLCKHCFSFTMRLIWYELHFMFLTSLPYAEAYLICPVFVQGFKWSIQNRQCSTFLSCGSICFQLLAFNWWSSSNFILIFSMDNCSISQNPAKSWEAGLGWALGFCATEKKKESMKENILFNLGGGEKLERVHWCMTFYICLMTLSCYIWLTWFSEIG